MKKAVCVLLSLLLWMFAGCKQMEKQEIIVFAAASLQESLTQITRDYMAEHDVEIVLNFDSSGTLRTQILEGAQCRIFISAGQECLDTVHGDIQNPLTCFQRRPSNMGSNNAVWRR